MAPCSGLHEALSPPSSPYQARLCPLCYSHMLQCVMLPWFCPCMDPLPYTVMTLWALLQKLPTKNDLDSVASMMEAAFHEEIAGIKQEVTEVSARVSSLEINSTALCHDVTSLQVTSDEMADQIAQLHLLLDDLENCNRRRNIRICGLPDATRQNDLKMTVTAIFNDCLERSPETPIAIYRVHRTLGPRGNILQRAWHRGNVDFDGAQITLLPDVSRRTLQMCHCMRPLLEKFIEQGITYKVTLTT